MRTALQFLFVAVDDLREGMEENKKSASPKKNCAYSLPDSIVCIKGWHVPTCGDLPQPTLRGSRLWLRLSPSCASGFAFRLHGEIHNTPSPMADLLALTSPPPDYLFSSIHQNPTIPPNPIPPNLTKSSSRYQIEP